MFDATGSYSMTFLAFATIVAVSSLLVLTAVPPSSIDLPSVLDAEAIP
jgi:hypothetical protein